MEAYATEEQQLEAIKNWFKKYGSTLSWAILIALAIGSAFTYWRHHQEVLKEQASDHYIVLIDGLTEKDETTVKSKADVLLTNYSNSPYATLAAFALAFEAVGKADLTTAERHLEWIIKYSKQPDFQAIARIRLIRLLIAQKKFDEGMALLDEKATGFLSLMYELKGDILLEKKDLLGAKKAYETALGAAPEEGMHGPLLKMKLEEFGSQEATKS